MKRVVEEKEATERGISELRTAMKSIKSVRLYTRYNVILMHFEGYSNKKIAEMFSLEEHAVSKYIKNYREGGLVGLEMKYSPGAPSKLNKEHHDAIIKLVTENTPDEVGFECKKNWTIELIRQWVINTFNITVSHSGMGALLHKLNLSYTRPTYVMKKADKEKQEEFKIKFEDLKKTP